MFLDIEDKKKVEIEPHIYPSLIIIKITKSI